MKPLVGGFSISINVRLSSSPSLRIDSVEACDAFIFHPSAPLRVTVVHCLESK